MRDRQFRAIAISPRTLPIFSASMRRELQISFNKLTRLPASIGKLKRLRRLIINNNRLEYFPDEIGERASDPQSTRIYAAYSNIIRPTVIIFNTFDDYTSVLGRGK